MKRIYVIAGGTLVHIAPHFALCAPAFGTVGREIYGELQNLCAFDKHKVHLVETRMAEKTDRCSWVQSLFDQLGIKHLETNEDLEKFLGLLKDREDTRGIVLSSAVCDFEPCELKVTDGETGEVTESVTEFGKGQERLSSKLEYLLELTSSDKVIQTIRSEREDIFLVGFKTTAGTTSEDTYLRGLKLLRDSSANLVFANDIRNKTNMIVTPEEVPCSFEDRRSAVRNLCEMMFSRLQDESGSAHAN